MCCGLRVYHPLIQRQYFFFLNTRLKQWPLKLHECHSTCLLVTHDQNEILHDNIELSRQKNIAQYYLKTITMGNNTDHLTADLLFRATASASSLSCRCCFSVSVYIFGAGVASGSASVLIVDLFLAL